MRTFKRKVMALVIGSGALGLGAAGISAASVTQAGASDSAAPAMCGTLATAPTYKHVMVIMEENFSYTSIYKSSSAPYINSVMTACGLATNYHNITHFSLPNYIGMTSGYKLSQLGPYLNDCLPSACSVPSSSNSIFNEVASKGGWKGYDESMPSACDKSDAGNYAPKHNPAVYYKGLSAASCKANDVALGTTTSSALLKAFASESTAPAYAFVTPNLVDDMHQGSISAGDNWLKKWLPLITASTVYKGGDTAIFIIWDEGEPSTAGENCVNSAAQDCHVVAMVVAPSVKPGTTVGTSFSHYSFLKTAEDLLGVPELGSAKTAVSMASGFNL